MMKKLIKHASAVIAVITAMMCVTLGVSAYEHGSAGIDDQAGIYTESQIKQLEKRQEEVAKHTGWNIVVVTTNGNFGGSLSRTIDYAERYYDDLFGRSSSGILYLIDLDYRHVCISGDADYKYFNDARVNKMLNACEKCYKNYDDVGNLNTFYNYVEKYYDKGPFTPIESFSFPAAFIFGAIAAGIGVAIVLSSYKFHYKPTANNYLDGRSINFYRRTDMFVREYTTRTRVDSGGSGGGSHHGSSGGHHHGGGSRGGRR